MGFFLFPSFISRIEAAVSPISNSPKYFTHISKIKTLKLKIAVIVLCYRLRLCCLMLMNHNNNKYLIVIIDLLWSVPMACGRSVVLYGYCGLYHK
jgi:hypothetical protein